MTTPPTVRLLALAAIAASPLMARGQVTPYFFDGFDITEASGITDPGPTSTFNLNADLVERQGGPLVPISWETIVPQDNDPDVRFQHQLFPPSNGAQPLQLAEVGVNPPGSAPVFSYKTMVSPDFNFKGEVDGGVLGKRITFSLDVGVIAEEVAEGAGTFTHAGITIGAPATLIDSEDQVGLTEGLPIRDYFSLQFVEDSLPAGLGAFAQAFDGADGGLPNIGTVIEHSGGNDPLAVQLDIDDPSDGNPWDGVGSTVIDVSVNGAQVYSFEKTGGGYTDNYITLFGIRQLAGNTLATHTFDDFTVWVAPTDAIGGDYNFNGVVDAADYTVYRDNEGQAISLRGEDPAAITPGFVDEEDYIFWRDNFGASATANAVPEPASALLVAAACGLAALRRR